MCSHGSQAQPPERERLFFALWPDEETRSALAKLARKRIRGRGRLVAREALHVTLFFLGSIDRAARDAAIAVADTLSAPGFELSLDRLGAWHGPRVAWSAPAHVPDQLIHLVEALRAGLGREGFGAETRPYRPHVTLARKVREGWDSRAHPAIHWPISAFCLVRSFTEPAGVRYEPQRFWRLETNPLPLGRVREIWDTAPEADR